MSIRFSSKISFLFLIFGLVIINIGCQKEEVYEQTRLFRPALKQPLSAIQNVITVNMAKIREATGYVVEVSRDSFKTIDFNIKVDTNYVVLDEQLLGEGLLYNTLYQIRVTALGATADFNSRPADLGAVRTERFPSIIVLPRNFDVTDTRAKVRWTPSGALVTNIKIFAATDFRLTNSLGEYSVPGSSAAEGEHIIDKLNPSTKYQIAIYSGATLRGWVDYETLVPGVDKTAPNVVDLSESEDPNAVIAAFPSAPDGAILLLKKGIEYTMPSAGISKSITIKSDYGFSENKAALVVGDAGSNWAFANGAKGIKVVFDDLEVRGKSFDAHYVFNPANTALTDIEELRFENCIVKNFRGIMRIREMVFIRNFIISNSVVSMIRDYGIFTTDTDGENRASIDNIVFKNSTFSKIRALSATRQNIQSWIMEDCTFNEFTSNGQQAFRFRGAAGRNNVVNGMTIRNCIFGSGWDETNTGNTAVIQLNREGMKETAVTVINSWSTTDLSITPGNEVAGFPSLMYNNTSIRLWADPKAGNFNISDLSFGGRSDSGDPRWRIKL
jgi:hypothetical protein